MTESLRKKGLIAVVDSIQFVAKTELLQDAIILAEKSSFAY